MKYPVLGRNPRKSLFLPNLDGGINLNKDTTDIDDKQLSDANNLTLQYGVLQTRPAVVPSNAPSTGNPNPVKQRIDGLYVDTFDAYYNPDYIGGQSPQDFPINCRVTIAVELRGNKLFISHKTEQGYIPTPYYGVWEPYEPWEIRLNTADSDSGLLTELEEANTVEIQNISILRTINKGIDTHELLNIRFTDLTGVIEYDTGQYARVSIRLINDNEYIFYEPSYTLTRANDPKDENIYVPTTIINKGIDGSGGTVWEDYNLLTPAFKEEWALRLSIVNDGDVVYHTVGPGGFVSILGQLTQKKIGINPNRDKLAELELTGVFTLADENGIERATYNKIRWVCEYIPAVWPAPAHYELRRGRFVKDNGDEVLPDFEDSLYGFFDSEEASFGLGIVPDGATTNLYVTFYAQTLTVKAYLSDIWTDPQRKMLSFRKSIRFGGARSGLESGTRLFMYDSPLEPNLIRWSSLSNDLYFPENNFAYIGGGDPVTALAKQENFLAVFKKNETYAIEYKYDIDEQTNKTTVYFPVTPIDPGRGCDCPKTIQLINNRLVWAHSSGEVFCLIEANQYSERSIIRLGANIGKLLRTLDLSKALSMDTGRQYLLFVDETVLVWEYEHRPLYIYASLERTQDRLVWLKWTLPFIPKDVSDNAIYYEREENGLYTTEIYVFSDDTEDKVNGVTIPIESSFKTKKWHFGVPYLHKKINEIAIGARGTTAVVTCYTDSGEQDAGLFAPYTDDIDTRILRPRVGKTLYFGISVQSGSAIKINSLSIDFNIFGGAK